MEWQIFTKYDEQYKRYHVIPSGCDFGSRFYSRKWASFYSKRFLKTKMIIIWSRGNIKKDNYTCKNKNLIKCRI